MPAPGGDRGTKPDKVEVFCSCAGIKRGGWSTYCPAQRSWDGLVGGQVALEVHTLQFSSFELDRWVDTDHCSFGCRE